MQKTTDALNICLNISLKILHWNLNICEYNAQFLLELLGEENGAH